MTALGVTDDICCFGTNQLEQVIRLHFDLYTDFSAAEHHGRKPGTALVHKGTELLLHANRGTASAYIAC